MNFSKGLCVAVSLMASLSALADETVEDVIARLQVKQTSEFSYTQTRQLQLLNTPWEAEGKMYLSPETMVIEQHSPKHTIVAISGNKMRYVEPQHQVVYVKKLKRRFDLPGMGSFLQLLYGQPSLQALQEKFEITFVSQPAQWMLSLQPKKAKDILKMQLTGNVGDVAKVLTIDHADGDSTHWAMTQLSADEAARTAMNQVLKRAASVKVDTDPQAR